MRIKTLHGSFCFDEQRFKDDQGNETESWLQISGHNLHNGRTIGLEKMLCKYVLSNSYRRTKEIIIDITGEDAIISPPKIREIGIENAAKVCHYHALEAQSTLDAHLMPEIQTDINIYNKKETEVIIEIDSVLAKEQKAQRNNQPKEKKHFVFNTLAAIETTDGQWHYINDGVEEYPSNGLKFKDLIKSAFIEEHGKQEETITKPVNVIAISDGAKDIRNLLQEIFDKVPIIILDWYHLKKKVNAYMSMFGLKLKVKKEHIKIILKYLWFGNTEKAINHLRGISVKRDDIREELIKYLIKHKEEIINYKKRKQAGKTIGSGLIENTVDLAVSSRQKGKKMSWRKTGSKALATLATVDLNGKWDEIWNYLYAA